MVEAIYDKVSLYINPKRPIADVVAQLKTEIGNAQNIAGYESRTGLTTGLIALLSKVQKLERIPENGIALFADGGDTKVVIPNKPLVVSAYFSDDKFHEEFLL